DSLSASDVNVALEFDEPLEIAEVTEAWLRQVATGAQESAGMVTPGLTWDGSGSSVSNVKVDGHTTESRARYRVVTSRFLAASGALPALPSGSAWIALPS